MDPTLHFKRYLLYSICLHAVALIFLILFMEPRPLPEESKTKITMLRLTPRLGSPRGVPEGPPEPPAIVEPQPVTPPEKPKTVEPPPPPKEVKKTPPKEEKKVHIGKPKKTTPKPPAPKTRKTKAPEQEKLNQALAGINQDLQEREIELQKPPAGIPPPGTIPGSGKPGLGSPQGKISARDPAYARYQSRVRSKIIRSWVRTHTGNDNTVLRARVAVRINASGSVISKRLSRRSGNASFDNSALRAVGRASPLPPPPPLMKEEALREGFIVDFNSRVLGRR